MAADALAPFIANLKSSSTMGLTMQDKEVYVFN